MSRLEADRQAERRDWRKMMMKMMDTSHMEMVAENKPERDMETMACRETTQARLEEKELTSVEMKPEVAQQEEVPIEDAEVMPVGELKKKMHRDQKLAAERRHQKPKYLRRENCGPQKKLAIDCRGTTRHAKVAWKMPIGKNMSRRATVVRLKRDILRVNKTQEKCRSRKDLAAEKIRMTHCAEVVRSMRHRDRENAAARSQRRQALRKRSLAHLGDDR
jgi:hypothetical protein